MLERAMQKKQTPLYWKEGRQLPCVGFPESTQSVLWHLNHIRLGQNWENVTHTDSIVATPLGGCEDSWFKKFMFVGSELQTNWFTWGMFCSIQLKQWLSCGKPHPSVTCHQDNTLLSSGFPTVVPTAFLHDPREWMFYTASLQLPEPWARLS